MNKTPYTDNRNQPLKDLLNLANVPRWTICPRLKEQNVAEHSFNVAVIAGEIGKHYGMDMAQRSALVYEALVHDAGEATTGDLPSTEKAQRVPVSIGGCIIKLADLLEAMTWWNTFGAPGDRKQEIWLYLQDYYTRVRTAAPVDVQLAVDKMRKENDYAV